MIVDFSGLWSVEVDWTCFKNLLKLINFIPGPVPRKGPPPWISCYIILKASICFGFSFFFIYLKK